MFPHRWCSPPLRNAVWRSGSPPDVCGGGAGWTGAGRDKVGRGGEKERESFSPVWKSVPPTSNQTAVRRPPPAACCRRVRDVAPPAGMSLICGRRRGEGDA